MKISEKAQKIEPSLTRKLFNMAKQYDDVIDLTLGDPDIKPSEIIRDAAVEAVKSGRTRYSANAGLLELRKAVSDCFSIENSVSVDPEKEIIITVGGMEALFLSLSCMIDEGDEVIVIAPYYVNYIQMIKMCGGVPVVIDSDEKSGFQCSSALLEKAVSDKTVAIIINSPCNPTGMILSHESLIAISEIAKKYDLSVVSDEVYKTLIYDGKYESIITIDGMKERTVVIDSMSKRFSMTGYRLGYAVAPNELISSMTKMQENVAACAPLPSQYAGIAAYMLCREDDSIRTVFAERRNYLAHAINDIPGIHCHIPQGAFYLFVNISETGLDGQSFAYQLLEQEHVAVVPGVCYGEKFDRYVRIAYTLDIPMLKEAVRRISRFAAQLKK